MESRGIGHFPPYPCVLSSLDLTQAHTALSDQIYRLRRNGLRSKSKILAARISAGPILVAVSSRLSDPRRPECPVVSNAHSVSQITPTSRVLRPLYKSMLVSALFRTSSELTHSHFRLSRLRSAYHRSLPPVIFRA